MLSVIPFLFLRNYHYLRVVLYDNKRKDMMKKNLILAVVALIVMAACNEKKTMDALSGEWNVVAIGEMAVADSVDAFMGFDMNEKVVYGSTGCNQLTGAMPEAVSDEPLFAALGSTRRMCHDMSVEDAMLPALGAVVDFKVDGDKLYLLDAAGNTVMSLQKRK